MASHPRLNVLFVLVLACTGTTACSDSGGPVGPDPDDAVASVVVNPDQAEVDIGSSVQFTATVRNGRGETVNTVVSWSSVSPAVASVDASGLVTGVTEGNSTITATAGGKSGNAAVTVNDPSPPQPPSNVVAAPASNTEIQVTWTDNSSNEDEFRIDREQVAEGGIGSAPGPQQAFSEVGVVGPDVTSFADSGLGSSTTHRYRVRACNSNGCSDPSSASEDVTTNPLLVMETAEMATGTVGVAYAGSLRATGGDGAYTWSLISGGLPSGLSLTESGTILGTPTLEGGFDFTLQAQSGDGQVVTGSFSITIHESLGISTSSPFGGVVGVQYFEALSASGGAGSYVWSVSSGVLPPGISLAPDGILSGVPTEDGPFRFMVEVESGGLRATREMRIAVYLSEPLRTMLRHLEGMIEASVEGNLELLPRNPHLASYIEAKVAMLRAPGLADKALKGRYFGEAAIQRMDGIWIPSLVAFPADTMREGALADLTRSEQIVGILEGFLDTTWPLTFLHNWYGFRMGHSGGGGRVYMEDRGTYAARGGGITSHPHDPILAHELAHTYIGHEWLTQFLHLYVHNVIETGSEDVNQWIFLNHQDYVAFSEGNTLWKALLDIYQLIGPEAMGRAYHDLHLIGVPYGSELSPEARQTFIDQAPANVKDQVRELVLKIG